MSTRFFPFGLLAAALLFSPFSLSAQSVPQEEIAFWSALYDSFVNMAPDPQKAAAVEQLMLNRDAGTIVLEQGTLYLCKPVGAHRYAAVFVGKGTFHFTPPIRVEQDQLERYTKQRQLSEGFTSLVFFCGDSTLYELERDWAFEPASVPDEAYTHIRQALSYISDPKARYVEPDFLAPLLNGDNSSFLHCHFMQGNKSFFYLINPYDHTGEEVNFMLDGDRYGSMRYWRPVNQFHSAAEYAAGKVSPNDGKEVLKMLRYDIETVLDKGKDFSAVADLSFSIAEEKKRWVAFQFYPDLMLDSAFWEDGTPAAALNANNGYFWVRLRDGLERTGEKGRLRVHYHGDVIERVEDWFHLKSSIQWYPHHGYKQKARFDMTFRVPKEFRFVSIGKKVSEKENAGIVTTRWVTDSAVRNASFNLGFFDEHVVNADSLPPITIWMSRYGHAGVGVQELADYGITSGANMEEQVARDVEGSIRVYQKIFGPYHPDRITVTEIPAGHGEAFPGLIHISQSTFQRTDASGWDYRFRAHEVAHQWWGASGVDFLTYHDRWLSEGFADYSSLMYLQGAARDKELFAKTLRTWRADIKKHINAGPVWMGHRLGNAYNTVVYEKGAWVLHMIRNLMLDLKTMKEDRFFEMMRDFYATYRGREASTEDFQAMVEKHMDSTDMSWFFDQWIYGTAIPTYTFDYSIRPGEGKQYIATIKVEQRDVPPDFRMYVPLKIDYGKEGVARLRVLISGSGGEFELPPLPFKPKEIVFNDLESVLCEID